MTRLIRRLLGEIGQIKTLAQPIELATVVFQP